MADFGTAKKIMSGVNDCSSNSGKSEISYLSGTSAVSYISGEQQVLVDEDLVGTEYYVSPEMLTDKKSSFSSDLWALGVIIYQLYTN